MPGNTGNLTWSQLAARGPRYVLRQVVQHRRGTIGKVIYREGNSPLTALERGYTIALARSFRLRYLQRIANGRRKNGKATR